VLAKMRATYATESLRDLRDRAILMVAFASGGRRRSEIAGLRVEQLTIEQPIEVEEGPPSPLLPFMSAAPWTKAVRSSASRQSLKFAAAWR